FLSRSLLVFLQKCLPLFKRGLVNRAIDHRVREPAKPRPDAIELNPRIMRFLLTACVLVRPRFSDPFGDICEFLRVEHEVLDKWHDGAIDIFLANCRRRAGPALAPVVHMLLLELSNECVPAQPAAHRFAESEIMPDGSNHGLAPQDGLNA